MSQKVSVLVVCADPTLRNVYGRQIRMLGADVAAAGSLKEAMALAYEREVDRIVCAFRVGELSGAEVLRKLSFVNPNAETVLLGGEAAGNGVSRTAPAPFDYATLKSFVAPVRSERARAA